LQLSGPMDSQRFPEYLRISKFRIERCLGPDEDCDRPAINAHSVQRSRFLELLADSGHVLQIELKATAEGGLHAEFESVGIRKATAFPGLCAIHDDAVFAPIEKSNIDLDDPEHLFLLAYRSSIKELHEQIESASKLQGGYLSRVRRGLDPPDGPSRAGIQATHRIITAYETHCYKADLDCAYRERDFSVLEHHVVLLDVAEPVLAGSCLYSVDEVSVGDYSLLIHLNVLPVTKHETAVVLSYKASSGRKARRHLRQVLGGSSERQMREVSQLVLDGCGNLVFSPSAVAGWSDEKRDYVIGYFMRTAWRSDLRDRSPHLQMFRPGT